VQPTGSGGSSENVPAASSSSSTRTLEIAHVLFLDIVAYSRLTMDEQESVLRQLQDTVRQTAEFTRAQTSQQLISLPTGDGMALVFFGDPEASVRCASELSRALRGQTGFQLRMGIHTGPVYRVADINANRNVAGGGINIAQRVMDCGDAGHILLSSAAADVLRQVNAGWDNSIHDLGEAEVKHGVRVHLYNLYTEEVGNREVPEKLRAAQKTVVTNKRKKLSIGVIALGIVATLAIGGFLYSRRTQKLTEKDTIVLADFANTTGETVFDGTLKQALVASLEQSPFLSVVSDNKVNETLQLMGRPENERVTEVLAREICVRVGSKALLAGSIAKLGSQYVLGLKAINCKTQDSLGTSQGEAENREAVLHVLGQLATTMRSKLGESLVSVRKFDAPLEEDTTSSLEALQAYSEALKIRLEKGEEEALPLIKRAAELDPNFAMSFASLGNIYVNLGQTSLAVDSLKRAYELRERVSRREKYSIAADYFSVVTGETEKANQQYELLIHDYPRDIANYQNLGFNYVQLGQYEKAVAQFRIAIELNPTSGPLLANLALAYIALSRFDEARSVIEDAAARKIDHPGLHICMYWLAFFGGDAAGMERQVAWATGKPGLEDIFLVGQSDTEVYYGRLQKARELIQRAVDSAKRNNSKESAASAKLDLASDYAAFGNAVLARQTVSEGLTLSSGRDARTSAALTLAMVGDSASALKLWNKLNKDFPLDTMTQGCWLPTIQAEIQLSRGAPAKAIEILQTARAYELGGRLYPAYVRGQAYLSMRQSGEAAAEFQKILSQRGVMQNSLLVPLSHLGLARAHAMTSDIAGARKNYQDLFTLWKDADPDIPILKEAKTEYAKLQ
jgi:tetratricopeptide (TPR) repeat protein/class 3 adenylate cyclase